MMIYQNMKVWEKSHKLTLEVYLATASFPTEERYGLTSQLRRGASSVPANIAEGCGRNGRAELARFLDMSLGSASELEYHLLLAKDLAFLDESTWTDLTERAVEVKRMLAGFLKSLRTVAA